MKSMFPLISNDGQFEKHSKAFTGHHLVNIISLSYTTATNKVTVVIIGLNNNNTNNTDDYDGDYK